MATLDLVTPTNQLVFQVFQVAIGARLREDPYAGKNPAAVALWKLGAVKGERAGAEKMTAEERQESARKAALAQWKQP